MKTALSEKHLTYGGISLGCPFIAVLMTAIYQQIAYRDELNTPFFGLVLVGQWFLAIGVGSLIGLVFAGISLKRKSSALGVTALLVNLVFALWLFSLFAKKMG